MRDMMWIYAASILLLSEVWSMDQGPNQNSTNTTTSYPPNFVVRHLTFNQGSEANLTCSNKTWNETIFVTWRITLKNKNKICKIAFTPGGSSVDHCNDGKSLRNTSSGQSYLHIPNFSNDDVGNYRCESVYIGGIDDYMMYVNITVSPTCTMWLEHKDNKMVAVCRAAGGKPAANISWSHAGYSWFVETNSNGFLTVESRLELPEGMDTENLTCVVRHQSWEKEETVKLSKGCVPWRFIIGGVVIIVLLAGVLFFTKQKQILLRRCKKSVTSPSKSPPTEDVEEVEPYASYVQRVNSIYNSSADLFT